MLYDITKMMTPDEILDIGVELMTDDQRQALAEWGLRMYRVGQHIVADIEDIKYDGRLIVLDDGTRWEVDAVDAITADMWLTSDKVVVIDSEMFKLDELEKVSVQQEF